MGVEGLGAGGGALQADLAAAHSELEAERQGRAAQTGAFRAQLDEVRAAKEEACRDAVDWAEESSRFKGEVTALLTKCQKLEEDKAAAIESNGGLEADLAAARRETDEVVGRLEGAVASLAQAKTEQERLYAETSSLKRDLAATKADLVQSKADADAARDARDAAIADARAAARRFSQELAAARASGETQAAADARAAAELQRDLVAARPRSTSRARHQRRRTRAWPSSRPTPTPPTRRATRPSPNVSSSAEALVAGGDRDELQAGRETIQGKAANLQRRLTALEAELAAAQQTHEDRLSSLAEERDRRVGDERDRVASLRRELAGSVADRDDLRASVDVLKRRSETLEKQLREERAAAEVASDQFK